MYEEHIEALKRDVRTRSVTAENAIDAAVKALKKQERYEALLEAARRFVADDAGEHDHDDLYHAVAALKDE